MKVRTAHTDDLTALLALRCALWPHLEISAHEQLLRGRIESSARFVTMVLVDSDGQLCGFVELMHDVDLPTQMNRVRLQAIFVTPPMRRNGGATVLLEAAQRWAHARGANSFYCDLPLDDEQARDMLRRIGFAEQEHWVRATRAVSAPLEIPVPQAPERTSNGAPLLQQSIDLPVAVTAKAYSPLALIINIVLFIVAIVAFANTNIYANDRLHGVLMPLLDIVLVLYFLCLLMVVRYRKKADSNARAAQLFRIDD